MPELRMVRLLTAANAMEARIIAARLGAEGIVWEFRGSVDGPLALGPVEVLVDADGLESARELLLFDEVESSFAHGERPRRSMSARDVVFALVIVVAIVIFALARMTSQV